MVYETCLPRKEVREKNHKACRPALGGLSQEPNLEPCMPPFGWGASEPPPGRGQTERLNRAAGRRGRMVLYARDIVEKEFLSLTEGSTVMDAAKAMKARKRGFVLVGSAASPRGIVTEWDILSKVVSEGLDPVKVTLGDVMTRDLLSIDGGAGLAAVSQLMSEHGVRRLLVKEHDQVIGYITSRTMLARMNDYVDKVSSQISMLQAPWF